MLKYCVLTLAALTAGSGFAQSKTPTQGFNPDTSINFLTLYKSQKREGAKKTEPEGGFALQEAEIQFMGNVDAYFRAVAMFAVHPEHAHAEHEEEHIEADPTAAEEEAGEPEEKGYAFEPEELRRETILDQPSHDR